MLDRQKHQIVMTHILKDIYSDINLASSLGFKGGTAAFMFYDLPRFSVDLDFDLLEPTTDRRTVIYEKIRNILLKYGEIKDEQNKSFTIFFALSYEHDAHQIKIEVNCRRTGAKYEMLNYFGMPVLVSDKKSMFAAKLIALMNRKKLASRDLFDIYFFLKNLWDIDRDVFESYGITSEKKYIAQCIDFIEKIPDNVLLKDLGELIDAKQKDFVRTKIKDEVLFLLRSRWGIN